MKKMLKQLQQNKGMSLLEILISVAISMIVMVVAAAFISNGSIFFKNQSGTIDVQNELMECSNKLNDALMQSTDTLEINIGEGVNGARIYTAAYNEDAKVFTSGKGSARLIEWNSNDHTLYVMDDLQLDDDNLKKGYLMGSNVSNISISISDDCYEAQMDGYEQPLTLILNITVSGDKETRSETRVITLRNELNMLKINGVTYTPNSDGLMVKTTTE